MITLEPGDTVVAVVNHRDCILVFTEQGRVYHMRLDLTTGQFVVQRL